MGRASVDDPGRGADFAVDLLREVFAAKRERPEGEGLRERKKRELRQRISDTATAMFIARGFDEVRVSEVAVACDVSEKTVFNYFPTKEALVFDREDDNARDLSRALADRGPHVSITDAVLEVLEAEVNRRYDHLASSPDPRQALQVIDRFRCLIAETPSLVIHLQGMKERLTRVAAEALAERAGVDPDDPEPQVAAAIVMALWSMSFTTMNRHAVGEIDDFEEVRAAVIDDLRRAAKVADTGLSSFSLVVQPTSSASQLRDAAAAADQARRQVLTAVRQARAAWLQVKADLHAHHAGEHVGGPGGPPWSGPGGRGHGGRGPGGRGGPVDGRSGGRTGTPGELRKTKAEVKQATADIKQAAADVKKAGAEAKRSAAAAKRAAAATKRSHRPT